MLIRSPPGLIAKMLLQMSCEHFPQPNPPSATQRQSPSTSSTLFFLEPPGIIISILEPPDINISIPVPADISSAIMDPPAGKIPTIKINDEPWEDDLTSDSSSSAGPSNRPAELPGSSSSAGPSNRSTGVPRYARVVPPPGFRTVGVDDNGLRYVPISEALRMGQIIPILPRASDAPIVSGTPIGTAGPTGTAAPIETAAPKGTAPPIGAVPSRRVPSKKVTARVPTKKKEPFDAAKTGKIPSNLLHRRPNNGPAVCVRLIDEEIGLGLVAARPFHRGDWIFHEAPAMDVPYVPNRAYIGTAFITNGQLAEYERFKLEVFNGGSAAQSWHGMELLRIAYPRFACEMGLPTHIWHRAGPALNHGLGHRLAQGKQGPREVDREEYEQWISRFAPKAPMADAEAQHAAHRQICRQFFHSYAFTDVKETDKQGNSKNPNAIRRAYFYLVASLINHRCTPFRKTAHERIHNIGRDATGAVPKGPNCEFRIGKEGLAHFIQPSHIAVRALRDILKGEELTINYGKTIGLGFKCRCLECQASWRRRTKERVEVRTKNWLKQKFTKKNDDDPPPPSA